MAVHLTFSVIPLWPASLVDMLQVDSLKKLNVFMALYPPPPKTQEKNGFPLLQFKL